MAVTWSTWYLIGLGLIFSFLAVGFFIWLARRGYFTDVEEVKYALFRSEEEEPAGENWN